MKQKKEIAVFGGGCFWCTEAVYQQLHGVVKVVPGYSDGHIQHPKYEQVCAGNTGHAEVIRIEFDPAQISYHDLLTVFFAIHDPTTVNRQGNDSGTQYRSIILYTTEDQKLEAEQYTAYLQNTEEFKDYPIVTQIKPLKDFYEAEDYHHEYYNNNITQPYCQIVINPKLKKLKDRFHQLLNKDSFHEQ